MEYRRYTEFRTALLTLDFYVENCKTANDYFMRWVVIYKIKNISFFLYKSRNSVRNSEQLRYAKLTSFTFLSHSRLIIYFKQKYI